MVNSPVYDIIDVLKQNGFKTVNFYDSLAPGLCYVNLSRIRYDPLTFGKTQKIYEIEIFLGIREADKKEDEADAIASIIYQNFDNVSEVICEFEGNVARISFSLENYVTFS